MTKKDFEFELLYSLTKPMFLTLSLKRKFRLFYLNMMNPTTHRDRKKRS